MTSAHMLARPTVRPDASADDDVWAAPPRADTERAQAAWWRRAAATVLDIAIYYGLQAAVFSLFLLVGAMSRTSATALTVGGGLTVLAFVVAQLVWQGRTGATIGKRLLGIRLVSERTGAPIGVALSLVRPFVHLLDILPLGVGYLWPLVDARRQTFADKATGTVVLRHDRHRPGIAVPSIAGLLAVVMLTGSGLIMSERSTEQQQPSTSATGRSQAASVSAPSPAPPPVGPLPPMDLGGRIAPAASGFRTIPDSVTELGPLTVEQVVRGGPVPDEEVSLAIKGLQTLGMQDGFGRAFEADRYALSVAVYRFAAPDGAASLVELATDATARTSGSGVPGAIVLPPAPGSTAFGALFSYGSHAYELTLFGESGAFDQSDVETALRRQYDHVLLTG